MNSRISLEAEVSEALAGKRLDQAAASLFPDYSRARLQAWIRDGSLRVDGDARRVRDKVCAGDLLRIEAEPEATDSWSAEAMALNIVYEDSSLLVIDKPAGAVVHPAAGHREGTLLNGLLHHCPSLREIPRAGIVHRLDKDTTGLMVVAKRLDAHTSLVRQLQARSVTREYEAVVNGVLTGGGRIDQPIGRHPVNRKKQAVRQDGKAAVTHYSVATRYAAHTHIRVRLETGRTHQIRVHMAHLQFPLIGDKLYGGRPRLSAGCSERLADCLRGFDRQALHARRLALIHPETGRPSEWETPLPRDMCNLLATLGESHESRS